MESHSLTHTRVHSTKLNKKKNCVQSLLSVSKTVTTTPKATSQTIINRDTKPSSSVIIIQKNEDEEDEEEEEEMETKKKGKTVIKCSWCLPNMGWRSKHQHHSHSNNKLLSCQLCLK